ncbi:MAG: gliding motility-associated C-terminal domain-containing protein, partial [Taibaiella sp.]|nr:gliding motility-associated C-terminal domain-containing protein [Taibaiella sp.]
VVVDSIVKAGLSIPMDSTCSTDTITVRNILGPNPPAALWYWNSPGGILVAGGGTDSARYYFPTPGLKTISLTISKGGCTASDVRNIYIGPPLVLTTSPDDSICPKETAPLVVTSNSTLSVSYNWTPASTLSCNNCPNPSATPVTSTTYTVYAVNSVGCKDTGYITVTVDTPTNADILFALDTVCVNERLNVKNSGENMGVTGYLWSVDTGNIVYGVGTDSIIVYWTTPGIKTIFHKAFRGLCETIDSQAVTVIPTPIAGFEIPKYTCLGQAVSLFPLSGAPHYKWSVQDHNITDTAYEYKYNLSWNSIGSKTVKLVVNDNHCADSMERTIDIYPYPIAEILHSDARLCKGKEFTLEATEGYRYSYAWSPPQFFTTNTDNEVKGIAEQTGYIILEVTNEWNCSARDSFFAEVQSCCELLLPNAFTPDGNGRNDIFRPVNPDGKQVAEFIVANRRGQIVYKTSDSKGWDGFHNGQPAAQDTYNYYIRYICNG